MLNLNFEIGGKVLFSNNDYLALVIKTVTFEEFLNLHFNKKHLLITGITEKKY